MVEQADGSSEICSSALEASFLGKKRFLCYLLKSSGTNISCCEVLIFDSQSTAPAMLKFSSHGHI